MVSAIPQLIDQEIESHTGSAIRKFSFCGGGCINNCGKVATGNGVYFLKWNDLEKFPGMFEAEAKGLALLRSPGALSVPEVVLAANAGPYQFLLLEFIHEGVRGKNYWVKFGSGLAALHRSTAKCFGLDHNNYIGSLPQINQQTSLWPELFELRLKFQLRFAVDKHRLEPAISRKFDRLFSKLRSLMPDESPALLHGDLWSGNVMTTFDGNPCMMDPAVYYGNREADLAMTQLFGGFDPAYLQSYEEGYPLLPGYRDRFDLYNLYPLMVHVNLFGGGYVSQLMSVLKRYV